MPQFDRNTTLFIMIDSLIEFDSQVTYRFSYNTM